MAEPNLGPVIRFGKNSAAVLRHRHVRATGLHDVSVTGLTAPTPAHAEIQLLSINSNRLNWIEHESPFVQVRILSTNSHFLPQWSSNAVDWVTPLPQRYCAPPDYQATDFIDVEQGAMTGFTLRLRSPMGFFRAMEDKYLCRSTLRRIARQKEVWAYEGDYYGTDFPVLYQLWTSCTDQPQCPTGGHSSHSQGEVNRLPYCRVPFHELP